MGTENSNYSYDDQAGGEVQGTVCASSLFWSWGEWRGRERHGNTLQCKGIQGEAGPVAHCCRHPSNKCLLSISPWGKRVAKPPVSVLLINPCLACVSACTAILSLPTSLTPKGERKALRWGVLTVPESLGNASQKLRSCDG